MWLSHFKAVDLFESILSLVKNNEIKPEECLVD